MTKTVEHRRLPLAQTALFDLVLDIERYPEFVPGYQKAAILSRQAQRLTVWQEIGMAGLQFRFRTTATFCRPEWVRIHTAQAPFREMTIDWRFQPEPPQACSVWFTLDYALRFGGLPGTHWLFKQMAAKTVDAFVRRARQGR